MILLGLARLIRRVLSLLLVRMFKWCTRLKVRLRKSAGLIVVLGGRMLGLETRF